MLFFNKKHWKRPYIWDSWLWWLITADETLKCMVFVNFTHYTVQKPVKSTSSNHKFTQQCLLSRFKSNRDPLHQPCCTHYWQSCHFKRVPNPLRTSSQMHQRLRLDLIGFSFFQICSAWTVQTGENTPLNVKTQI